MRAIVKDIRPHLVEVLRTVDFRSCKGADELREKMKLLMELYRQMTAETDTTKCKTTTEGHSLACENGSGPEVQDQLPDVMPENQPQLETTLRNPSDNKPFRSILPPERPEKLQTDDSVDQGCIVGNSAFGWNFITFPGDDPIYYGRTKESFRTANVTS
uniref:Uncharacterized protein n=1 Tax=Rhizophora mucronata TaxID=61149 RepID=A0A2P2PQ25_RHIMU